MRADQARKALMILNNYEAKAQKLKCAEELAELETALLKHINKGGNIDEVLEEMADALIMIEQVKWLMPFGENRLEKMIDFKLDRQLERIRRNE